MTDKRHIKTNLAWENNPQVALKDEAPWTNLKSGETKYSGKARLVKKARVNEAGRLWQWFS